MYCNIELFGAQLYCNVVDRNGLMSVTIHLLYRDSSVQFRYAVGLGHWVTIQSLYCDMVVLER